ncbi:MAG: Rieske 2Fe-2S domain-containing protein [Acetobacteraceae bacterium]|nr:Rieske 2Fe-2S domain-containing protein [Acetobacteraceae bacterium]
MAADVLVKNAWYVAGLSREFALHQLQGQVIAEKPLVLWRTAAGQVVAFDERCCHKRMPLSQGRFIENGLLECAYHGLCYDATGHVCRCRRTPMVASRLRRGCDRFLSSSRTGSCGCGPVTRREPKPSSRRACRRSSTRSCP